MPVIIKTSELQYKDGNGDYHGINAVAEKKVSEQIADLDAAITTRETRIDNDIDDLDAEIDALGSRIDSESTRANGIISQMRTTVDGIESQRQTMIESIASIAGQATDKTLSQSGAAADAKAAGDAVSDLKQALNLGAVDLLPVFGSFNPRTHLGVTFTSKSNGFVANGTSTGTAYANIYVGSDILDEIKPGSKVHLKVSTTNSDLRFRITCNSDASTTIDYKYFTNDDTYIIPSNTAQIIFRVYASNGKTFTNDEITVRLYADPESTYPTNIVLEDKQGQINKLLSLLKHGSDYLNLFGEFTERTHFGVTFTPINNGFNVSGTATDNGYVTIYSGSELLDYVVPGDTLFFKVKTTNPKLRFRVTCNNSEDQTIAFKYFTTSEWYEIPEETATIIFRVYALDGGVFNNDRITVTAHNMLLKPSLEQAELLCDYGVFNSITHLGVTFTPKDHGFIANGTASGNAYDNIYIGTEMLNTVKPGSRVYVKVNTTNPKLLFRITCNDDTDATIDYKYFSQDGNYLIPLKTTKIILRAYALNEATFTNDEITVEMYPFDSAINPCINGILSEYADTFSTGNYLKLDEIHDEKNSELLFYSMISSNSFELEIGRGETAAFGTSVVITNSEYFAYQMKAGVRTLLKSGLHGLNIEGFISVQVDLKDASYADARVSTATGEYVIDDVKWRGTSGNPYAKLVSGELSLALLKYYSGDYNKPVYAYGDSYFMLGDSTRWPYHIQSRSFDAWLLDGYGSRYSKDAIKSFRTELCIGNPRYVLWAMGMNDPDRNGVINENWKNVVEEIIAYCDANGIELILATIPCVPSRSHIYKNAYVRASGKRYIDFAKAVNAEAEGSSWYTGMLSNDSVHPAESGAIALANRAIIDMPELCGK